MSDFAIVVYGASGFTGRLVCAELARRKVSFAIAGRDRTRLTTLAASLPVQPQVLTAPLDDAAQLQAVIARGKVVLACAGPFGRLGTPVREAALAAGRHYLDITGEAAYMMETHERDAEAKKRGVALVNAVGFDVVPTDCAAALASEAVGGAPDDVKIAIKFGGRATQGTTRSAVEHADSGGLAFVDGGYRQERVGAAQWSAPFPEPLGVRTTASIPWGDMATAPRSTGTRNLRTYVALPKAAVAAMPLVGLASKALAWAPAKKLAERWIQSLPEGPSDAERARAKCAVVAEATRGDKSARVWVTCGDGYDFTAVSAVECAVRAAADGFTATGALTPSQAFGARTLLDALKALHAIDFAIA
ncbi:MAG TPA: saccharopine dehydrogenase NADP-binding domain-containing protein [Polyangia bacterium]|jgi:saccharopine dehydrogenase (NAD+, L-lysine-forming)|nr:saccharopine dehydrogenase NADP-binding domain-containing protein [Polyangia bacterium]HWE29340.1 saccharopine dehydrogenase NADP-binding domain-containing protein [Polyangia bacterium]